jgi:glucan phosphoethanolaminetransferase (alkaline phosphatase superfamily)
MQLAPASVTKHTLDFTMFMVVMCMYFTVLLYYAFLSLSIPGRDNNEKVRFSSVAIAMTLFLTMATAVIVVMPFESQMLQFINEHGIINLSIIMINYLYAPSTEQQEEYESDEDEPSQTAPEIEMTEVN